MISSLDSFADIIFRFKIDNITIKPELATDETRETPYLSPFLFKILLPLGVELPSESSQAAEVVATSNIDPDALAKKFASGLLEGVAE